MRTLALLGASGVVMATVVGGPTGMVIGNLCLVAAAGALFLCTLNIEKVTN